MKETFEKDDQTRKLIQQAGQEEPSWNFTSALMEKIQAGPSREVFVYKPVITARGWWLTGLGLGLIFLLVWLLPSSGDALISPYTKYIGQARPLTDSIQRGLGSFISGLSALTGLAGLMASVGLLLLLDQFAGGKRMREQP